LIESEGVDFELGEGFVGNIGSDNSVRADLGVVADATEEAVGDACSAAGAAGDLCYATVIDTAFEDGGGAADDLGESVFVVELEAVGGAESVAKGLGEKSVAGGGADESEVVQFEADVAGFGTFAEDEVYRIIFHRGVKDFLDGEGEAVDFVDEEDVAGLEAGEERGEVTGTLDGGAGSDADRNAHFGGDDHGEGGLAEARRAVEEEVVEWLAASFGGLDGDLEAFFDALLAGVLVQVTWAECGLRDVLFGASRSEGSRAFGHWDLPR